MIDAYIKRIQIKIHQKINSFVWNKKLDAVEKKILAHEKKINRKNMRVLMGPSFAIWSPSFALDKSLSLALRLRGVDVIPIYCDSIQHEECNYHGGDWGGKENFLKNCSNCKKTSQKLWESNPNKPLPLSKYLSNAEVAEIATLVSVLDFNEALAYTKAGIKYGAMAKDIMVNNYLVASPTLIKNHEHLIKVHLQNLLMVSIAYEHILDEQKPDRVISNDSYYGMWAILEQHCKARQIPFYSHWPATNYRAAFAYNDAAMNLDFTKSWGEFSKIDLTDEDNERINKWLSGNRGLVIDTTKLAGHEVIDTSIADIDINKPTLVLAANVIWDLAALNKQIVFKDMIAWIIETIEWFVNNRDFQLIIRPHPIEASPQIPRTRESVAAAIELCGIQLPENVFLLKAEAKVTFKDLMSQYNVRGITVHTTTVGFEYAAKGMSVITTGKSPYRGFGFTIDPIEKQEYFDAINNLLNDNKIEVPSSNITLAKKFIKFYHFHYYSDIKLFAGHPPKLAENYMELLEEEGSSFGHVVNSIIEGIPVNSENRWLPES